MFRGGTMNLKALLLFVMVIYDFSLHLVFILDKVSLHPLYPEFPLFYGLISYSWFCVIYYGIEVVLAFTLLFSGVTVKTTNITQIHNYPKEEKDEKIQAS